MFKYDLNERDSMVLNDNKRKSVVFNDNERKKYVQIISLLVVLEVYYFSFVKVHSVSFNFVRDENEKLNKILTEMKLF